MILKLNLKQDWRLIERERSVSAARENKSELDRIQGRYFHVVLVIQQIKCMKYG